jgi:hypothetical protein
VDNVTLGQILSLNNKILKKEKKKFEDVSFGEGNTW